MGRILAVDPGDQRIGLAVSDLSGTIANPLTVVKHISRQIDSATIVAIAVEQGAEWIVVGQALDSEGKIGPRARKAQRIAEAIQSQTDIPVVMWDESDSTRLARQARLDLGVSRKRRSGHLDELAAVVILQSYLDHLVRD